MSIRKIICNLCMVNLLLGGDDACANARYSTVVVIIFNCRLWPEQLP